MKVYQKTHVGKVRKNNEDSLLVAEPNIFVAADGMGGAAAGEIASGMLIDTVKNFLSTIPEPFDENILSKAILKANAEILREAKKNPQLRGMGTTATILHLNKDQAYYAHLGDSRLYRLRNSALKQMTIDHSYVELLVALGELTPEQARIHPMKNLLTQAVGVTEEIEIDAGNFKVESGDIFLLCTDGLTNMIDDSQIEKILMNAQKDPAEDLINAALEEGGHDNITAIVIGC